MENATAGGKVAGGSTVLISGTYFASAGQHMAAVQVRGRWANLHMLANRLEDPRQPGRRCARSRTLLTWDTLTLSTPPQNFPG